jgi:hypothetical protein
MANKKVSIIKGVDGVSYDIDALTLSGKTYSEIVELINAATNGAVVLKGTLGTGGTVTTLETAAAINCGHAYKVIADGTYASQAAKVGDLFICYKSGTSSYAWMLIPAGDDLDDTWRPIKVNGTQVIANGTTSGALNLKSGDNIEVSASGNDVTFKFVNELPNARLPRRLQEYSSSGYSDANEATVQGWHYMTSTATNRPPFKQVDGHTGNDYRIMTTAYSSAWVQQIATDFRSNDIFTRNSINGSWQPWTAVVKLQRCGTDHSMPTITDNAIPRWDTTRNATLQNSGITIDDSNNIAIPGKVVQGTVDISADENNMKNMNLFANSVFISGNGAGSPNTPKVAGFYLGKSASATDVNRHLDIVSGGTYSYIDFNTVEKSGIDFSTRLIVDAKTGLTELKWDNSMTNKKFQISGNVVATGSSTANGFKHSDTTKGNNNYVLLAGGDAKPLTDFVTSDGTKVTSDKVFMSKNFTYTAAIGVLPKPSGSGTINCQGKTLDQFLDSILSQRVAPTVTNPSYTLNVTATKNYGNEVGSIISKLSYTTTSSAGSYNYGSKEDPNSNDTGITLSYNVKYNGTSIGTAKTGSKDGLSIVIDSTSSKTYATLNGTMTCSGTVRTPLDNLGDDKDGNDNAYTKASTATKTSDAKVTITGYYEGCYYGTVSSSGGITSSSQLTSNVIRGLSKTSAKYSSQTLTLNVGIGTTAIIIACDADKTGPTNVVNTTVNAPMTTLFGSGNVFAEVYVNSGNNANYKKKYKVWIYTPASGAYTQSASLTITLGS